MQNVTPVADVLIRVGAFAPVLIIGGQTVIDVLVDWGVSKVFHQEFNPTMSILTSLASNIAFSIDSVNMATGGFCLTATDLTDGHFRMQRIYNSVIPCRGILGKNWMLGVESRLFIREEEGLIDVICMDGHAERFALEDGTWKNRRNGDSRYQLQKPDEEEGYVLLYIPEQKCYDFDSMGRLVSVRGKGRNRLAISYQEAHISQVVTSAGYVLDFKYEGDRVSEIRDEAGRTVRYKYENDCLKAVCHVDEGVTTYHYDEGNHITQVIDQNGHAYVRNEYDHAGRVTAQYYLDGTKSILTYDLEKRENTVYIEGLGRTERYRYNEDFLVTHTCYDDGTWEETGYDQWTNHIYEKDRNGNVTRRLYDSMGRLCREMLPSGQAWEYRYDDGGNLLEKKADTGEELRYAYDEYGFLLEETEKIREGEWKRRQYERDAYGRPVSVTDSLGHTTSYSYSSTDGHLLKEPSCTEDVMGNQTSYEYDAVGRRICIRTDQGTTEIRYNEQNYPVCVKDGNGNELCRTYDRMGNLTAMTPPAQGAGGSCWIYRYDFFDRLIETIDPLGNIWRKERNLAGDILREEMPGGQEIRYEYDTDSRKLRTIYADGSVERCFYDGNGNLVKKVRPENYNTETDDGPGSTYTYDSMNRLTQVTDEDGRIQGTYRYDSSGNLAEQTDGAGHSTYYTYDLLGNRTGMWEPVEASGENGETVLYRATLYEYDAESNKIKERRGTEKVGAGEIPRHTHELRFTYDALNRLTAVEDQHGAKTMYRYNSQNQKVYESFRISEDVERIIHYAYDAAGNMVEKCEGTEERFRKPGGKRIRVWAAIQYEYDPDGNCVRMVTPRGYKKEWQYDALDRVVMEKEQDKSGGICRSFQYEYDAVGNLRVRRNHSMGKPAELRFAYDGKNRLTHLTDEGGNTTRLFYDRNDRIIKAVRPQQYDPGLDDGQGTCYLYDRSDRIVRITGPDGTVLQEQTYDSAGNVKTRIEGQSVYTEYVHDLAGDLLAVYKGRENAEKDRAAQRMKYDAWGNITGTEDGNGNRTEFSLDSWGRIVAVHTPEGGTEHYTYDHAGNITSTTDANGGTITYSYNSMGKVYLVTDQEGCSEYFYYDAEGRLETRTDRNGNRETTHYNMDGNLTYRRAEDRKGRNPVVSRYVYYPDGKLKQAEGGGIT
ncbi:MAG: sugar-binding protein, partial [Lachnospiraceae bacterium]|nr:sugar-binding protein [Lachnospiraceae bacterium]